jgi:hypothetical protein
VQSFHWTCVEPVASGWSGFFKLEICHGGENGISFMFDIRCVPRQGKTSNLSVEQTTPSTAIGTSAAELRQGAIKPQ